MNDTKNEVPNYMLPYNDFIFKRLFGFQGNEDITKDFVSAIIGEKINKLEIKNPYLLREYKEDKEEILDVRIELDNKIQCDLEIQVGDYEDIEKRILDYWAKLYHQSIGKGKDYINMKRTIVIFITSYDVDILKNVEIYKTKWEVLEKNLKIKLTDMFEIDIIELSKAKKQFEEGTIKVEKMENWVKFLINPKNMEELNMEEMSEEMKKAYDIWHNLELSEEERDIAERRFLNLGALEAVKKKHKEEGIKEGKKEIAKKMLEKGIDIETIIEITGLTKEEIEK